MAIAYPSPIAIEITSLCKMYKTRNKTVVSAVNDLHLQVPKGHVFGFLGANGAGKTTTIKMICGLVTPSSGTIRVNGFDVGRQRSMAMRQIGAVLEGTRNIYWRLSAWQNLLYFGHLKGCEGNILKRRAEQLLRDLELWDRRNDPIRTFSRGMQQKVAIACALIADPSIVLLDEPTLGLDVQASYTVKECIKRLTQEQGKTIVLTTHQLDIAQELCQQVAIMRKGKLLANQPLSELLHVFEQDYYEICLNSEIDEHDRTTHFPGFHIRKENNQTILTGPVTDQNMLFRYLSNVRGLNLPLLAVNRVEPDLEEVFLQLVTEGEKETSYANSVRSHAQ